MTRMFSSPADRMRQTVRELAREGLVQNALALWCVQGWRKTLPLVLLPFLARVLGPHGWGLLAVFQSFAVSVVLFIEFGFGLSATREVARSRDSKAQRAQLFAGVLGAQVLLGVCVWLSVGTMSLFVPLLRDNRLLLCLAMVIAFADGCHPTWYFVGLERMRLVALLEISSKSFAAALILIFVRSHNDIWLALSLQGLASAVSIVIALSLVYRDIAFKLPSPRLISKTLSAARPMFLIRSAQSLYTMGNAFLLGMFAGPAVAAYFAGPEKISRALGGLFNPIRETLYPRQSRLIHVSPHQAARLARLGLLITSIGGLAIGFAVFISAPLLIRTALGKEFAPAVPVLRALALLPFLTAVTQSVGMQWLLPLGRERLVGRIVLMAGLLNLTLASILVPKFAEIGMACAVIASETFVCVSIVCAGAFDRTYRFPFLKELSPAPARIVSGTALHS